MRYVATILLLLPLLAFQQELPPAEKQPPKDQPPTPRLDLYGDPLPEGAVGTKVRRTLEEGRSNHGAANMAGGIGSKGPQLARLRA